MEDQGPTLTLEEQNQQDTIRISLAADLESLMANPAFTRVFTEKFVKDYTLTQQYNLPNYTRESRAIVFEQATARGIFQNFLDEIIEDGKMAKESQADLKAMEAANNVED